MLKKFIVGSGVVALLASGCIAYGDTFELNNQVGFQEFAVSMLSDGTLDWGVFQTQRTGFSIVCKSDDPQSFQNDSLGYTMDIAMMGEDWTTTGGTLSLIEGAFNPDEFQLSVSEAGSSCGSGLGTLNSSDYVVLETGITEGSIGDYEFRIAINEDVSVAGTYTGKTYVLATATP